MLWSEEEKERYDISDDDMGYLEDEDWETYYLRRSDKDEEGLMLVGPEEKYYLVCKGNSPDWEWIKD